MHQENLSSGTVVENRNQGKFVITCLRLELSILFNVPRFHCRTSCDSLSESAVDTFSGLAIWCIGYLALCQGKAREIGH